MRSLRLKILGVEKREKEGFREARRGPPPHLYPALVYKSLPRREIFGILNIGTAAIHFRFLSLSNSQDPNNRPRTCVETRRVLFLRGPFRERRTPGLALSYLRRGS
jgi:hypothetical protein